MGQEARCACDWNGTKAQVKALIEPPDLILRGSIGRRIPIAAMKQIRADGDRLRFTFNGNPVALDVAAALRRSGRRCCRLRRPVWRRNLGSLGNPSCA